MTEPRVQPSFPIAIALVLFVMDEHGAVTTVGGDMGRAAGVVPAPQPGCDLNRLVLETASAVLPPRTVSSRFHPLMPRMHRNGCIVLPFWATGRLPVDGRWGRPLEMHALERLAEELDDPGIVDEANGAFRRALATDLLSHKMVQEPLRVQALAVEEVRRLQRDAEIPSIVALLPEEFTIEQLRSAVLESVRLRPDEAESSSNFRRRIEELIELRVLEPAPYRDESKSKGRPAQLYSFNARAWRIWLARLGGTDAVRAQRSPQRVEPRDSNPAAEWRSGFGSRAAPMRESSREPSRPPSFEESGRFEAGARAPRLNRVDQLESMVRMLLQKVERLSDAQSGEPSGPESLDKGPPKRS